jgi:hypothetical protein
MLSLETAVSPGEPIFIQLPTLSIGLHKVVIAAFKGQEAEAERIGDLNVLMRIREAHPWSSGVSSHGPLSIELDPTNPTMEQLWEGIAEINVRGPVDRTIKCCISMYDSVNERAIFIRKLPPVDLPLTSEKWRQHFHKNIRESKEAQYAYDTARMCELEFSADELGAFTIKCERDFTPLRWTIRRVDRRYMARLHEDLGSDGVLSICRIPFETPTTIESLNLSSDYPVPASGGLYVAEMGEFTSSIILPPEVRKLEDLRFEMRIEEIGDGIDSLLRLIIFATLWGNARLPGDLASATRQRTVMLGLTSRIFQILGGDLWGDAEASLRSDNFMILKRGLSITRDEAVLGAALSHEVESLASASPTTRALQLHTLLQRFVSLPNAANTTATRTGEVIRRSGSERSDDSLWLTELALRLASDPAHVMAWASDQLRDGLERLIEFPTVARAARFLVLGIDQYVRTRTLSAADELYAGWRCQ